MPSHRLTVKYECTYCGYIWLKEEYWRKEFSCPRCKDENLIAKETEVGKDIFGYEIKTDRKIHRKFGYDK